MCLLFQIRQKTSAKDDRPPPTAIGYTAIAFIAILAVLMVLFDFTALLRDAQQMLQNIRTAISQ